MLSSVNRSNKMQFKFCLFSAVKILSAKSNRQYVAQLRTRSYKSVESYNKQVKELQSFKNTQNRSRYFKLLIKIELGIYATENKQ